MSNASSLDPEIDYRSIGTAEGGRNDSLPFAIELHRGVSSMPYLLAGYIIGRDLRDKWLPHLERLAPRTLHGDIGKNDEEALAVDGIYFLITLDHCPYLAYLM